MLPKSFVLFLAVLSVALPAQSDVPTHRIRNNAAPSASGGFGTNGRGVGDFDGDGHADYVVAAPNYPLYVYTGRVYLYSGRTSALIRTFDGDQAGAGFGLGLADVGDADLDGTRDLAIGAPEFDVTGVGNSAGKVWLFSGKTGAPLWSRTGTTAGGRLGEQVEALGGTATSGAPTLAVAESGYSGALAGSGRIVFHRTSDGALLGETVGTIAMRSLGVVLASYPSSGTLYASDAYGNVWTVPGVGSITLLQAAPAGASAEAALAVIKDSASRLYPVVGRRLADTNGLVNNGTVEILASPTVTLLKVEGTATNQLVGSVVASMRDVDGDGLEEVGYQQTRSALETETRIVTQGGAQVPGVEFGLSGLSVIGSIPDVTGDGRGEWLQFVASGVALRFEALLFSRGLKLVSVTPGTGTFAIAYRTDMGTALAAAAYVQVFGFSGTAPGTLPPGPSALVPVNFDGLTSAALGLVNTPAFPGTAGSLDAAGRADSGVILPAGIAAALKGLELASATAVLTGGGFAATNPVVVKFP